MTVAKSNSTLFEKDGEFLWEPMDRGPMSFALKPRSGGEALQFLRFRNPMGTLAQAESDSEYWSFKRVGVWEPYISVRKGEVDRDYAFYRRIPGRFVGGLGIDRGKRYRISERMPADGVDVLDEDGSLNLSLRPLKGTRLFARVQIFASSGCEDWLVAFCWYLFLIACLDGDERAARVTKAVEISAG